MVGITEGPWVQFPELRPQASDLMVDAAPLTIAEIGLGAVPRGAVLILCDATSFDEACGPMNSLAEHGYESLSADLSGRRGQVEAGRAVKVLLERLAQRHWEHEQVGVIGYGGGAQPALRAAATYALGAAISVASLPTLGQLPLVARALAELRTPWLGLTSARSANGVAPAFDQLDDIRAIQTPVYSELICYPRAPERFYRDAATTSAHAVGFDSWQRTLEWLNNRVVPRLTPASLAWRARLPERYGTP